MREEDATAALDRFRERYRVTLSEQSQELEDGAEEFTMTIDFKLLLLGTDLPAQWMAGTVTNIVAATMGELDEHVDMSPGVRAELARALLDVVTVSMGAGLWVGQASR